MAHERPRPRGLVTFLFGPVPFLPFPLYILKRCPRVIVRFFLKKIRRLGHPRLKNHNNIYNKNTCIWAYDQVYGWSGAMDYTFALDPKWNHSFCFLPTPCKLELDHSLASSLASINPTDLKRALSFLPYYTSALEPKHHHSRCVVLHSQINPYPVQFCMWLVLAIYVVATTQRLCSSMLEGALATS